MNTPDLIRSKVLKDIESHGQSVIGVQGTDSPSFAYTIGLSKETGFELLCVGMKPHHATMIFNGIAQAIKNGSPLVLNVSDDRFANLPCMFVQADDRAHDYTVQADEFFKKKTPVIQMVMSDRAGVLPGQPGYDHAHMDRLQPLLFNLDAHAVNVKPRARKPN